MTDTDSTTTTAAPPPEHPDFAALAMLVARAYGVSIADLRGASRRQLVTHARQALCWLARRAAPHMSLHDIGAWLDRDHSTIVAANHAAGRRLALGRDDTLRDLALDHPNVDEAEIP